MTDGVEISSGRLTVIKGGITRLNTDDSFHHNLTTGINNTFSIPEETVTTSAINKTVDRVVGSCNTNATEITGSMRFTYTAPTGNSQQGLTYSSGQWYTVSLRASMWALLDGEAGGAYAGRNFSPRQCMIYSIVKSGTQVILRQRVYLPVLLDGTTYTVVAHTIQLKLKAGIFT